MNFEEAVEKSKQLKGEPSEQEQCELYALHQQATVGDAGDDVPAGEEAKHAAWKSKAGMSKEDAEAAYIKLVEEVVAKHDA